MKTSLKLILWLISTALVTVILVFVLQLFPKILPVDGFLFAFELHFLMMGWYAFSLPKLKLEYNTSYFETKPFENNGRLYTYFGVNGFRWFLKIIQWEKFSNSINGKVTYNLKQLQKRARHTKEAELAHLILAIHFGLLSSIFCFTNNVFWILFLNIIFHLYPIFVQRYNRPRYQNIISKIELRNIH